LTKTTNKNKCKCDLCSYGRGEISTEKYIRNIIKKIKKLCNLAESLEFDIGKTKRNRKDDWCQLDIMKCNFEYYCQSLLNSENPDIEKLLRKVKYKKLIQKTSEILTYKEYKQYCVDFERRNRNGAVMGDLL